MSQLFENHKNLFNIIINRRKELEDMRAHRLDILKQYYEYDTVEAVDWLRQNRDKLFACVYYPLCVEINVKDVQYANAIETVIGQHRKVNYLI